MNPHPKPLSQGEGLNTLPHYLFRICFFGPGLADAVVELSEIIVDTHVGYSGFFGSISAKDEIPVEFCNSVFCCCDNISHK